MREGGGGLILCFHCSSLPHYIVGLIASGLKLVRVSVEIERN